MLLKLKIIIAHIRLSAKASTNCQVDQLKKRCGKVGSWSRSRTYLVLEASIVLFSNGSLRAERDDIQLVACWAENDVRGGWAGKGELTESCVKYASQ